MRRTARLALLALAVLSAPAGAVEFSGTATTIARAYDLLHVELVDQNTVMQRVISYRPIDQTVQLSWDAVGKRRAWSFDVAVRGRTDLASGKGDPRIGGAWQGSDLDVLVATARWRSPKGLLGLTLGRQNAVTGFGWHAYDGVRLDFDHARHVRVFVDAGLPVALWDGGSPDTDGFTWATGVTGIFPKHGSIGVDYELIKRDADVLSEAFAADLELQGGPVRFSANADYSLLQDDFGETTARLGVTLARKHDVELQFSRVRPVFDSDSIFNAFELNPYDDLRLQYELRADGPLTLGGYVALEDYVADDLGEPGEPPVVPLDPSDLPDDIRRAAATMRWDGPRFTHRSEVGWQRGWTGNRLGFAHDTDWGLNPRWRIGGGASLHRYENRYRLTEPDETWAVRARVRHDHDGKWDMALELEQFFGRDRDTLRAMATFTTRFGRARGTMPWWGGRWNWSEPTGSRAPRPERAPKDAKR